MRAKERKSEKLPDVRTDYCPCQFVTASSYRLIFTLFILFFPHWKWKVFRKGRNDHLDKFTYRNSFCFILNGHFPLYRILKLEILKSSLHYSFPFAKRLPSFFLNTSSKSKLTTLNYEVFLPSSKKLVSYNLSLISLRFNYWHLYHIYREL